MRTEIFQVKTIRWIAVPISGIAVWYVLLLLGIMSVGVLDSLCPAELMISGMCTAPWHAPAFNALVLVYTGLVSAGVVLVPAFLAPSHRFYVALASYALGACFAIYITTGGSMWAPFVVSAVSGSVALWLAASKWHSGLRRD